MGRLALMTVVAVAVSFGIIGVNIRNSNDELAKAQNGYFKYNFAREMAELGIHYYLHCQDTTLYSGCGYPQTMTYNGGTFTYTPWPVYSVYDTTYIVCVGAYAESSYTMRAKFVSVPDSIPIAIAGGLSVAASPSYVTISGNSSVDGRNYDITGQNLVHYGDLPGLAFSNADDTAASHITLNGGGDVLGSRKDTVNSAGTNQAWAFADLYRQHVDVTITGASGQTQFGDQSTPKIVFADGSAGTVNFSGKVEGYGILLVAGDVKFSGGVTWTGLVVCVDTANKVDFSETGGSQIIGGVMVASKGTAGASLSLTGGGNKGGHILYSSQALQMATAVKKLSHYSIVDWYE